MSRYLIIILFLCCFCETASSAGLVASEQLSRNKKVTETMAGGARKLFVSPLAGTWYSADPGSLARMIDEDIQAAPQMVKGPVCALLLPHAGLQWSGRTAAYGLRQVDPEKIKRVIILGPSHRVFLGNSASVPDATHYTTPLGETPLDTRLIQELLRSPYFQVVDSANRGEHSVQVLLPMFQRLFPSFDFVPIVLGSLDRQTVCDIAETLRPHLGEDTLVVASSDFTHYGASFEYQPFVENIAENLRKLDMRAFDFIARKDLDGFADFMAKTGATICGRAAIEVLLALLPSEADVQLLRYDTSGAMTGDFSTSVSYLSGGVTGAWRAKKEPGTRSTQEHLSREDKKRLMALAKGTVKYYLKEGRTPTPELLGIPITAPMRQKMGAFVTLKTGGRLRGCIGETDPVLPLYQAVIHSAVMSAKYDFRFHALQAAELGELCFSISVIKPARAIPSYRNIVLGRDGIILEKDGRSALFLPHVAIEEKTGLEETLSLLCQKAGLPADSWRHGASFKVFEAIEFKEEDI